MNTGKRKIHLDFHTHPQVQNLCGDFDADRFADTLAGAHVDCVVLFAKDHYGYAFFQGAQTNPVHPHLQADFLPLAARACRERGISTEAYISVCLDSVISQKHPDWACRTQSGEVVRWGEPNVLLDPASPLLDEVVLPFTREVASTQDVDGLWFDIVMYPDDAFYSAHLTRVLSERGLPDTPESRGELARQIVLEAQQKIYEAVKSHNPELRVIFNNQAILGDTRALGWNDVVELESDPAMWPQYDLSLRCRYGRGLGALPAKPFHPLTTRFHRCWGDFGGLRSPAQLEFEIGQMLAAGQPAIAIGDQLHPSGVLEPVVYRLIGDAFAQLKEAAPVVEDAEPVVEIALLIGCNESPYSSSRNAMQAAQLGAARALTENHLQWTACGVLDAPLLPPEIALFLSGGAALQPDEIAVIREQVEQGRRVLACGEHVLGLEELVGAASATQTALAGQHLRFENDLAHELIGEMPIAVYQKVWTFEAGSQTEIIARAQAPLFDETLPLNYHAHGPVDESAPLLPAIVARENVILCGVPLPSILFAEGGWTHAHALERLLRRAVPQPMLRTDAPPTVELALHRRGEELVLHVVSGAHARVNTPPQRIDRFAPPAPFEVRIQGVESPLPVSPSQSHQTFIV